ncbi:MAG: NAD(P)H-dependent oxidoreductase [Lachnospiraceae bacterium]|nr:NAD(P)H-dependent oxidoreductase [Lachnospiraceae bacterium]
MKILLLCGSPRRNGNTEIMANAFAETAKECGHEVCPVYASMVKPNPCLACGYCRSHDGECIQQDDMQSVYPILDQADMVVFASPVYYFNLSAQIKIFLDRFYAKGGVGFHPTQAALLLDSHSPEVFSGAIQAYKDTLSYLKWEDKGIVTIDGMSEKGSMAKDLRLEQVRELARSL